MARIAKIGGSYFLELEVALEWDGNYCVAYCPALELSAYAKNEKSVKRAFDEVLKIFLDDTTNKGTLEKVLLGLGWTLQMKPSFKYVRPQLNQKDREAIKTRSFPVKQKIPATAVACV